VVVGSVGEDARDRNAEELLGTRVVQQQRRDLLMQGLVSATAACRKAARSAVSRSKAA
jgi:hypothetical protein